MTTPKEALEYGLEAVRESFASAKTRDEQLLAEARYSAIESALASLQGEDAVERVAQIIDPTAFTISPSVFGLDTEDEMERETVVGPVRSIAREKARAILATGLVAEEAAVRADEREKCAKVADSKRRSVREFSVAADIATAIRSGGAK